MKPNRRLAESERQASTITLQNTETRNRFSEVTATKYTAASTRFPGEVSRPAESDANRTMMAV